MEELRYPIGRWQRIENPDKQQIESFVSSIKNLPAILKNAVKNLDDNQLNTTYREGGWTLRQVAHHLADSHLNAYIRIKLALTEDNPTIKPYDENNWANLPDCKGDIRNSLKLLEGLHARWTEMLKSLNGNDWQRTFYHPESKINFSIAEICGLYSWHGNHHTAQITSLKERMKW